MKIYTLTCYWDVLHLGWTDIFNSFYLNPRECLTHTHTQTVLYPDPDVDFRFLTVNLTVKTNCIVVPNPSPPKINLCSETVFPEVKEGRLFFVFLLFGDF